MVGRVWGGSPAAWTWRRREAGEYGHKLSHVAVQGALKAQRRGDEPSITRTLKR
jgi:hypothetical protein